MASDEPNENTPPRFYELLRTLREEGVDFVLIGGFAVTLQGYVRTTKDIDIVPSGDRANYERLWKVLTDLKARPGEIGDVPVEHLIGMKERAGRDLDQVDVTALRRAHGLEAD